MKTTARIVIVVLLPIIANATAAAQALSPGVRAEGVVAAPSGSECSDGVVLDDGTLETGYGWVPSVIDGRYVQRFERARALEVYARGLIELAARVGGRA